MNSVRQTLFGTIFAVILVLFTVGFINTTANSPLILSSAQANPAREPVQTAYPQSVLETADISAGPTDLAEVPTTAVLGESDNALSPSEIVSDSDQYNNQKITVQGTLAEVIDNRTFRLDTGEGPSLLVLTQQPYLDEKQSVFFMDNDEVAVTGTFHRFNKETIEPDYDLRILDTVYEQHTDDFAIVVDSAGKTVDYSSEDESVDSQDENL